MPSSSSIHEIALLPTSNTVKCVVMNFRERAFEVGDRGFVYKKLLSQNSFVNSHQLFKINRPIISSIAFSSIIVRIYIF